MVLMAKHNTYYVTAPHFGEKVRCFPTRQEAHEFVDRKLMRMSKATVEHTQNILDMTDETTSIDDLIHDEYRRLKKKTTIKKVPELNIGSGGKYPSNALSNFAPHPFIIDGVECSSMEGFLQSLKVKDLNMQKHICTLVGKEAKFAGKGKDSWKKKQVLYWQGKEIPRDSDTYTQLIERAYHQLAQNSGFRKALLASGNSTLTHSIGRRKKSETVLTRREFTNILSNIRTQLQNNTL